VLKSVIYDDLRFVSPIWKKVSQKAKELICKMIEKNHEKRISAIDILNDDWIKQFLPKKVYSKRE
jgi:serine/threonine protein kinase